ncbi:hypothetical protein QWZ08_24985 [Ferruginibacter paludis]|uniref:hypothetical protein n=1 Tax=Ferruginibacter paludis TaxID=1310417 RepID=UPI0025B518F9|nr:hypothetical protein [Ferruginibacter paludis]MDN3658923.1 hypothetical protein [Ferruginibacter paludis]
MKKETGESIQLNKGLNIDFNYSRLDGAEFKRYKDSLTQLSVAAPLSKHNFALFSAAPAWKNEIGKGRVHGVVIVASGFIKNETVAIQEALNHNAKIGKAESIAGQGTYYLLLKS